MITPPTRLIEWKIDRMDNGAVLKRIDGERVDPKGWVVFDDRLQTYRVVGPDSGQCADDLELAVEILWHWRAGRHHPSCDCDCCINSRSRVWDVESG
jgi:hypothetical protein